jgi:hypothetical protein
MSLRSSRLNDNGDQLSKAFGETPPAEPIAPPKEITKPRQAGTSQTDYGTKVKAVQFNVAKVKAVQFNVENSDNTTAESLLGINQTKKPNGSSPAHEGSDRSR